MKINTLYILTYLFHIHRIQSYIIKQPLINSIRDRSRDKSPQMSIIVFGATGATGQEVVMQALNKKERVVAFCRDESKLTQPPGTCGIDATSEPIVNNKLTKFIGTVTSQSDVERAFSSAPSYIKGVVIALGGKPDEVGYDMLTNGTQFIINAMKKYNVKRIAVVTSIGTGDSVNQAPLFFKLIMWTAMKSIMKDKNNQEDLFLEGPSAPGADLEYTIVRPGGLNFDPPTNDVKVIDGVAGRIPRADVAQFCLDAILEEDFPYLRMAPCISSVFE